MINTICWMWTGALNPKGYGIATVSDPRRTVRVHCAVYEVLVGAIPNGYELDHLCRNKSCYRPDHLEAVTHAENVARHWKAVYRERTKCKRGHSYIEENIVYTSRGGQECKLCRKKSW